MIPLRSIASLAAALVVLGRSGASAQPVSEEAVARLSAAAAIQGATRARLGVLGDAFSCPDARFVSFRRSDAERESADQWYVASQLWSDAQLLATTAALAPDPDSEPVLPGWDASDTRCHVDKGFVFLDRLWDYTSAGYFPRSNPVGTSVDTGKRYTDDNLIAGLALLETARTTTDPSAIRRYIHAAQREADFLILPLQLPLQAQPQPDGGGLWDATFGGGFWWNTGRGDSPEGKPAQTTALAALFFARLYDATGDPTYRDWALRSLLWLDTILYDPGRQLYRWSVSFEDIPRRAGAVTRSRYFNYDQGIAIEAQLEVARFDSESTRVTRAQSVGRALHPAFWSPDLGGYNLEAGIEQVYTNYGAWTSLGHLALYAYEGDATWLELVRSNAGALEKRLRESDDGYAYRAYRCVDRVAKGCESGPGTMVVDRTRDTSAQAWVQHLQTVLAARLIEPPGNS